MRRIPPRSTRTVRGLAGLAVAGLALAVPLACRAEEKNTDTAPIVPLAAGAPQEPEASTGGVAASDDGKAPGKAVRRSLLEFVSGKGRDGENKSQDTASSEDSTSLRGDGLALPGWQPYQFEKIPRKTRYELVRVDGKPALQAVSENSASALRHKCSIDPQEHPWIEWRWKVSKALSRADCTTREGDDCAARIMLLYKYDPSRAGFLERARFETAKSLHGEYPPAAMLVYTWAEKGLDREFITSPYSDRVRMFPVRRGSEAANAWHTERRNHRDDFEKAFGRQPGQIEAVAIMSDTDNTQSKVTAWFRDLAFVAGDDEEDGDGEEKKADAGGGNASRRPDPEASRGEEGTAGAR